MIDLASTKLIVNTISFFIAYAYVVTIAGSFRAWVADKMGDPTAKHMGFLSFNPTDYMSPFGLTFLAMYAFSIIHHMPIMWGRYIPINQSNIHGKWRPIKLFFAHYSDTLLHIFLAIIGLLILILWFDPTIIYVMKAIVISKNVSHLYIAQSYPLHSSFSVVLAFILVAIVSLHTGLAVLEFLLNSCTLGLYLMMGASAHYSQYALYFMLIAPLLFIMFLYGPLLIMMTQLISYAGYILAQIVSIV